MCAVVGVLGGSGGVGASSFAAALAAAAGSALLIDVDVVGGGIDVLLDIEAVSGARWSGLRLAGGRLDPATLLGGLPRWGRCAVLAADLAALEPAAVGQVVDVTVAADVLDCVVLDLPRHECPERAAALERCDLVVVLVRADVAGVVAAHAAVAAVADVPRGLVLRRGQMAAAEAAAFIGAPLLGTLPALGRPLAELDCTRLPRRLRKVASGVLAGLQTRPLGVSGRELAARR